MSKKPNAFGQAGLAAYKKRQARTGEIGCFSPGSPLIEAAKDDPESCVLDLEWLNKTLLSIPEPKLISLREMLRIFEGHHPRGGTEAHKTMMLYRFLKDAEAKGHLAAFQKPADGPAPRRMTEAEVARLRGHLMQHPVPADFKAWDFADE